MNKLQISAIWIAACAALLGAAYILPKHMEQLTDFINEAIHDTEKSRQESPGESMASNACLCPATKYDFFNHDQVLGAKKIRSDWTRDLESVLEKELDRTRIHINLKGDFDIPNGHRRFDMLGPIAPKCENLISFGQGDEEKRACGLLGLLKQQQRDCTIMSLGSNDQWSFEEAVFAALPSCITHTFDCTVKDSARPPAAIASRTFLHRACIGETDATAADGKVLLSLSLSSLRPSPSLPFYLRPSLPPSLSFSLPPPLHSRV
jgi:hypothetical protein